MTHTLPLLTLALLVPFVACAADAPSTAPSSAPITVPTTRPKSLTLQPAALPRPALRYRLSADPATQVDGNAAPLYLMAVTHSLLGGGARLGADVDRITGWLDAPLDRFPRKDAAAVVEAYASALHFCDLAARRTRCDWGIPERDDGYMTLLPQLQDLRYVGLVLALRERLQIAEGKFEDAAHTCQTGLALAHHLSGEYYVIQSLVAAHIARQVLKPLDDWEQAPNSPNLYWALTDVPAPLVDFRAAIRKEEASVYFGLADYAEARAGRLTPEHYARLTRQIVEVLHAGETATPGDGRDKAIEAADAALKNPPARAKETLQRLGYEQARVDALTPSELLGLYYAAELEDLSQELYQWAALPFPQAIGPMKRAVEAIAAARAAGDNPLLGLPAAPRSYWAVTQLDRRLAELRTIETIRLYAATHEGRLPATLGELSEEAPMPMDPSTGRAFGYAVADGGAVLTSPAPAGVGSAADAVEVRIKVGK